MRDENIWIGPRGNETAKKWIMKAKNGIANELRQRIFGQGDVQNTPWGLGSYEHQ